VRIAGIIAEYNPFHNGHAWQIAQLRRRGFDAVVCVCSPGVVQRGAPALLPTAVRTAAALAGGADLVLCLPAPYAALSSEGFAAAGVRLLTALGCADTLCFGVEAGTARDIAGLAALLEGPAFAPALREALNAGLPLPAARAAAAERLCPGAGTLLRAGNTLLGVDYCRAILRQKSGLVPLALPRRGAAHNAPLSAPAGAFSGAQGAPEGTPAEKPFSASSGAPDLPDACDAPQKEYASASALRALAGQKGAAALAPYVPAACLALYRQAEAEGAWLSEAAFSTAALSRLRMLSVPQLRTVRGAAEGLEHRLAAAVQRAGTWQELIEAMKTKRYATARLRRFALDAALGYTAALPALPPYLHILGAGEAGRTVLHTAKRTAGLPLSHSLARLAETGSEAAAVAAAHAAAEDFAALCLRRPAPMGTAYTAKAQFVR